MQSYFLPEFVRARHAELLRDAEAYRFAATHRDRRRRPARRRTAR